MDAGYFLKTKIVVVQKITVKGVTNMIVASGITQMRTIIKERTSWILCSIESSICNEEQVTAYQK